MDSTSEGDAELRRRVRQQEVVAELGQQALETDDLDGLMHDAAVAVAETLDNEYAKVLELCSGGDEVFLRQGVGWTDGLVGSATVPTDLDSQAGYTLLSERPVIVDDLRTEERFSGPELLTDHDVVSGISVVIGSVEEPWGVLGTHTAEQREFTDHDANFVRSVANVLASAIENARTRRELEERERQLSTLVANVPGMVYRCRNERGWPMEFVSDACEDMTGYEPDALEHGDVGWGADVMVQEDREILWETVNEAASEGETFSESYRIETADGETRWVRDYGRGIFDESGELTDIEGIISDITERKEIQRKLEESERRYRTLAENFPNGAVGVYDHDLRYTLTRGNILGDQLPGADRLEGERVSAVFPPETVADLEPLFRAAVEEGETDSVTTELDGHSWRVWAAPLRNADGEVFAGLSFTQDVTQQVERKRRLEEAIEKLEESNERLEQFAYAASHDLQEPLRMVSSYLQLIDNRYADELDDDGEEFLDYAVDGADRMREMIEGLLEYSRVDTQGDPLEPVDLNDVLEHVLDNLRVKIDEHDAEITAESLPRVRGDASQLEQVFQNLLSNAIEYSGDGPPRIHIGAERDGSAWALSVSDDGVGIDPDDEARVFEVFQRLHGREEHDGTGIGLALCQRIVERHGGEIWVDSEPGDGSTFSFALQPARSREQ